MNSTSEPASDQAQQAADERAKALGHWLRIAPEATAPVDVLTDWLRDGCELGLWLLLNTPGDKFPVDMRSPKVKREADSAAQDAARAAGRANWITAKANRGVYLATNDPDLLAAYVARYRTTFGEGCPVNIGVAVGPSRLAVVDCDTTAEVTAARACLVPRTAKLTVRSPGTQNKAGEWVHKDGGHFWFVLPTEIDPPRSGKLPGGAGDLKAGPGKYVLVPPSVRPEGEYVYGGPVRVWTPDIAATVPAASAQADERHAGTADAGIAASVDEWAAATPWNELLERHGWASTGRADGCGCETWTAPGDHASPKSATAHDSGCAIWESDSDPDNRPLRIWTDNPGEELESVPVSDKGYRTVSKLQFVAAMKYEGDVGAAMAALGIEPEASDGLGFGDMEDSTVKAANASNGNSPADERPRLWSALDLHASQQREWLATGHVPKAAVTLLVGDEGIGKSLAWVWLLRYVTTGKPCPEFGIPAREAADVFVVATEDDWASTIRPRLEVAQVDLRRVHVIATEADGSGSPTFPDDMDVIRSAPIIPTLIIVDAWLDTVPAKLSVRDPQHARQALHPWKELATNTGAAVLLLTHTNRVATANARDKYGATAELRKKARMTLFAQADPDYDDCLIIGPEKSNIARAAEASRFRRIPVQHFPPTVEDDGTVPLLEYVGPVGKSSRELIAEAFHGPEDDESGELDAAEAWLSDYLEINGKTKSKDAKAAAKAEGIAQRTVERSAKNIGVVVTSEGFPRITWWALPGGTGFDPDDGAKE